MDTEVVLATLSIWLPVGRANFFSHTADRDLLVAPDRSRSGRCQSHRIASGEYVPHLRASIMRRVLEVLPRSFGYESEGHCVYSDEIDEISRPISVTVRLAPATATVALAGGPYHANRSLAQAGVTDLTLTVDEHGVYTFVATSATVAGVESEQDTSLIREALMEHVVGVFGGDFSVDRLGYRLPQGFNEGMAAVSRYNGMELKDSATDHRARISEPLGVLTFFQLNLLMEGLLNQSLLPSVFFERYEYVHRWLEVTAGRTSVLTTLGSAVRALVTDSDGRHAVGQRAALHRFLSVSAGALNRLRRSVNSVRGSMLALTMKSLHRHAPLVQLDLSALDYERTPELIGEPPNELQTRGYALLVTAKLPLIISIGDAATDVVDHLIEATRADTANTNDELDAVADLQRNHRRWRALLSNLLADVRGLENAVEHDRQEELLSRQERLASLGQRQFSVAWRQLRSGQRSRVDASQTSTSDGGYNALMLIATIVAVLLAVGATGIAQLGRANSAPGMSDVVRALLPLSAFASLLYFTIVGVRYLQRVRRELRISQDELYYEFDTPLGELVNFNDFRGGLGERRHRIRNTALSRCWFVPGGAFIEQNAREQTGVTLYYRLTFRTSRFKVARFEIEILGQVNQEWLDLRELRIRGASPRVLQDSEIEALVNIVKIHVNRGG